MGAFRDISGKHFGRLTAIELVGREKGHAVWLCRCSCGNAVVKRLSDLAGGKTKSCGCIRKETASARALAMATHRMTGSRLYVIWRDMRARCKDNPHYASVSICAEWDDFASFYEWAMANGYADNLTLDRIDVLGNYEPSNCRWATYKQQENNKTNTIYITAFGETKPLAEWCESLGLNRGTVYARYTKGTTGDRLFSPVKRGRPRKN